MSPTAVLYDIHGNLAALEAVLEDARATGAGRFVLGGDYALFGPQPVEAAARLRELGPAASWIRGNVDRWCAHPDQAGDDPLLQRAIHDCRSALGEATAAELGALPAEHLHGQTRFVHASPISDLRSFLPEPQVQDEELLAGVGGRRLVFGHTHLQFRRLGPGGTELVNPGSVGLPLDGDQRAAYALLHEGGALELRRVGYAVDEAVEALRERYGAADWAQRSCRRLESASL